MTFRPHDLRKRCFRCVHIAPAVTLVDSVPLCRTHGREALAEKERAAKEWESFLRSGKIAETSP